MISLSNSDYSKCRQCDDPAQGRDGLCRSCRGYLSANVNFGKQQRTIYAWDKNKDERLRSCYRHGDRKELSRALTRLANELRYPKGALRRRAEQLGLTLWSHVRWTPAEVALLEEYAGNKTVGWITRKLKAKTGIGRSYNAVKCKGEELGRSLRFRDGYTQRDLIELLGTTYFTVNKWIARQWIIPNRHGRISEDQIKRFLQCHLEEWHFKRVDEAWVKGMLFTLR
jgi:hypothetical protein